MRRAGPSTGAATGIVLLHGRGGSAADILSLMDHAALPDVAAIAPEAAGNSWWPTSFLAPSAQMAPFVTAALAQVDQAIATLTAAGIPPNRIWLAGFSQGACLATEAYARQGDRLAGLLAFSGALVGTGDAEGGPQPALYGHGPKSFDYSGQRPGKVWLSVHDRDPHIPRLRVEETARTLTTLGATVETRVYPGAGHGIMRDDLTALRRFLTS
ncbi:alpha/beta hydrolase [Fuscovulum ytuae]|uniref:Dienelactone hydrolase family protein n=1 Tax=Fuscovulum ytuae TaxID=3042299 RepID=A0ABY8Q7W9_9RHOB|nr:dienelactone hydrolase family protein [Fuscovulum sp. YMD61]WGV16377.1 dienelactone hydrolase family protein [Fuscovulum sp. YMD61]